MADNGFFRTLGNAISGAFKANPIGAIATGATSLLNLGLGIADRIKANKLQNQWDTLNANRPTYEIGEGYTEALDLYKQRAAQRQMPGQDLMEENIQQASARARSAAERGSISSATYGAQASDIYSRELEAIQDLGIQAAKFQWENQGQLAQGYEMMGAQQEKAQDWNKLGAWATRMNQLESQMGARTQNANQYLGNVMPGLLNFAGTQYWQNALNLNRDNTPTQPPGFQSSPVAQYDPQSELKTTLSEMIRNLVINYPR